MRLIISPAKKMKDDLDSLAPAGLPRFLPQAQTLLEALQGMSRAQLKALWACNDALTDLNLRRVERMELTRRLTPAILAYEGIQYQYMAPGVFETGQLGYIQEHLRILSGFYGLLRPFDGVRPYRLEMQAKLAVNGCSNLYAFWGSTLADALCAETDLIINLASQEYSKAVRAHLAGRARFITCTFGEVREGRVIEKGTRCKMARGEMVRFLAEQAAAGSQDVKAFGRLGYTYSPQRSTQDNFVFLTGQ